MRVYVRKMKTPCKKNLEVFDFKEEAEVPEIALRIKSKLENPKNAIDKYTFLATAAAGKSISPNEINYVPSLGIDAININHVAINLVEDNISSAQMTPDSNQAVIIAEEHRQSSPAPRTDLSGSEVNAPDGIEFIPANESASPSNSKLNSAILDLLPSDEAVDMNTDENGSMRERSSSTSTDVVEDNGVFAGPSSDHCIGGWEMDNEEITTVVIYPDYLVYCDSYYTDSLLTFTSNFIEMEGSTTDGVEENFKFKWGIEDILHIKSHWYERVEMAMVKIHVLAKDTAQIENVECTSGTELKFAVIGPNWYGRQEAIASLNVTYKALWSSMLEPDTDDCCRDTVLGHNQASFTNYFPNFDPPFEEVVYPKGDADAVSISKRDFDLLQPDTFVNDTIIDFYIKYLKNKIKPEERLRFHFFNSFFFRKLADPDKDPLDASEGRAAFQRVKKWTRKVNLFEKDYVFIPINYNYHWSLIVMCHLGDVATYQDEDVKESIKVPCVLHMDSIRGSHTGLKGLVQSYLKEEWKERHQEASEDISSRFDDLRFISLELPQQQNSFDCGLFLLHYVELFLEEAPVHFNPFKITNSSNFLNIDWFPPADASLKRVIIQRLIYNLFEHPSQEPPTASNNEHCNLSGATTNIHEGTVVNFFSEKYNPSTSCQKFQADQGTEISLSSAHYADDPRVALKQAFEPGSFLGTHFPDFNQTANFDEYKISPTPVEEGGGHFVCSPTEPEFPQHNEIPPAVSAHWHSPVIPEHKPKNNTEPSPETSISRCEDSVEIVNIKSQLDSELTFNEPKDQTNSPSPVTLDDNANEDNLASSMDILPGLSSRFSDTLGNKNGPVGSDGYSGLESDVQSPTKKMRMTEPEKLCG